MRGTTPTITITTDMDLTSAEVVYVTFRQDAYQVVEKEKADLTITAESVELELSQKETLKFKDNQSVEFQVRARFADGTAVKSNVMKTTVTRILKDGVI